MAEKETHTSSSDALLPHGQRAITGAELVPHRVVGCQLDGFLRCHAY